jgi:hypothetical protein
MFTVYIMSSIILLKPILDVLYEDAAALKTTAENLSSKLCKLEKDLEDKNAEISTLYSKNRELETLIAKYELHFETIMPKDEPAKEPSLEPSPSPTPIPTPAPKGDPQEHIPHGKRSRKDYMREYQRAYRKKQKDIVFDL